MRITSGPGKLTKALGIDHGFNGKHLNSAKIWIEEGEQISSRLIVASARVGIDYAGEDAALLYRFVVKGHPNISAKTFTSKFYDH